MSAYPTSCPKCYRCTYTCPNRTTYRCCSITDGRDLNSLNISFIAYFFFWAKSLIGQHRALNSKGNQGTSPRCLTYESFWDCWAKNHSSWINSFSQNLSKFKYFDHFLALFCQSISSWSVTTLSCQQFFRCLLKTFWSFLELSKKNLS